MFSWRPPPSPMFEDPMKMFASLVDDEPSSEAP